MPRLAVLIALLVSVRGIAHEGHGIPGALPPAPHGGTVQEATHNEPEEEHEHGHEHGEGGEKEEAELFFEGVYKGTELKIFPLALMPGNTASFVKLSAKEALSNVSIKIEYPRAKKTEVIKATLAEDAVVATLDARAVNRFIVHITADHDKETKSSAIQIETE